MARSNSAYVLLSSSLILGGLWGCASSVQSDDPEVNTGLSHLADDGGSASVERQLPTAESPIDIEAYTAQFDDMNLDDIMNRSQAPVAVEETGGEGWLASLSTDPGTALWMNTQRTLATMHEQLVEPTWQAMLTEHERRSRSPEQQIAMHVEQIAAILRSQGDTTDMDIGRLMALSAMEAVRPGTLNESVDPIELELLRPEVRSTLEAVRMVVASHAHPVMDESEPVDVSEQFLAAADRVWEARPMNIKYATLARRVVGYGRYEPFATTSFVAGRPQRMIIYTEIDNFSHRPFRESDLRSSSESSFGAKWTVEVSQELRLYRDGTYIWGKSEQPILETSRNQRRDFYLVHQIELPPTLTVGPYELKIIMRDKTSGEIDEAIIPFTYVADYAAARAE